MQVRDFSCNNLSEYWEFTCRFLQPLLPCSANSPPIPSCAHAIPEIPIPVSPPSPAVSKDMQCVKHSTASAEPQSPTHAAASAGTQATNKPRTQGELVLSACSPSSLCPSTPNLSCSKTTFCESIKYISNHKYIKSSSQENYFKISCLQSSPN